MLTNLLIAALVTGFALASLLNFGWLYQRAEGVARLLIRWTKRISLFSDLLIRSYRRSAHTPYYS